MNLIICGRCSQRLRGQEDFSEDSKCSSSPDSQPPVQCMSNTRKFRTLRQPPPQCSPSQPPSIEKLVSLWACPATRFCQSGILFITSIVTIVISNQIPSAEKPPFINIPGQAPQSKSNASRTVPSSSPINLFCKLDNFRNKLIYL